MIYLFTENIKVLKIINKTIITSALNKLNKVYIL